MSRKLQAASKLAQIQQIIRQENDFAIPKCGNLSSKSQKIIIWRWFLDTNIHNNIHNIGLIVRLQNGYFQPMLQGYSGVCYKTQEL